MPLPRYRVTGLPPVTQHGLSAFLPHYNRLAGSGAQQYKDGVTGHPGSPGVPLARQCDPAPDITSLAFKGQSSGTDAPWEIYPNQYYALPERNYRPGLLIQMYDMTAPQNTTMIPVPAVSGRQHWLRHSAALAGGVRAGSRRQVPLIPRGLSGWKPRSSGNGLPGG